MLLRVSELRLTSFLAHGNVVLITVKGREDFTTEFFYMLNISSGRHSITKKETFILIGRLITITLPQLRPLSYDLLPLIKSLNLPTTEVKPAKGTGVFSFLFLFFKVL